MRRSNSANIPDSGSGISNLVSKLCENFQKNDKGDLLESQFLN